MQKSCHYTPSLTEEEIETIANAAMNVKIPTVEIKELSKCNILENFLHADADKISLLDQKCLDDNFSFIRDASVIHGRFANGPINPRCPLTPYEMGVNEASAWLVRRSSALLTHQRLLSDLARQVVKFSALNLKQFKSSSHQSNQYFQTPERRLSSNARSGIHYRLQGQYRNSMSTILDGEVISDDNSLMNRGLGSTVISHFADSQFVELSRNDVTIISSVNEGDIRLEMQIEEVDKCLDELEILRYSGCAKCDDVRILKIPCNDYTVIDSRALARCVRLRELDLSENSISEFPRDLNLPKLKYLEITGNRFIHQPLVEQFPNLVVLNFEEKFKQNMNFQAVAYFCPRLKFINGEYFEEPISDYFHNYIMEAKIALDPIIRNKWESEFGDRCPNILNNQERMSLIDELVQQLKDRNLLIDDNLSKYKDLLIFKLTEDYLKSKLNDTEDELLAGGAGSVRRSTSLYCNIDEDDDDDDEKLLERFIDVNQNEMAMLQELTDELVGNNVQDIVSQVMLTTTGPNGQPQQYIVQQPQSVFHIGQSLRQNKSVAMTVIKPQAVKGRPVAEFLPGELRNKDYVKGYMASEIYKKAVKDTLGQKGTPKRNKVKKQESEKNWSSTFNGPLNEIGNSSDPNNKKRGRPPKGIPPVPGNQNYQESVTEVVERSGTVPARPKKRRTLGPYRSLRDLYKTEGNENDVIDYDPLHFIRCHAKDNAPLDQDTKVWRCVFEPNPNQSNQTTHIVATCGGECVCLIDCKVGKVLKRFKREDEEFMCLAWTTLEIEPGKRLNILAAAGKLKEIRLLFPDFLHYCDMRGHQEDISALVFHPSMPQILFSGDTKASIFIWDIGTPTANQSRLMRYQLLMRLRCPRLDVNPVLNLVFLDHYSFLVAGCEDGIFAWKITEYRSEKREREPDMELKLFVDDKIDVPLDSISYDGLAQLSRTALVFKIVHNSNLLVFDFGTTLERRKGLQKVVPIDICGTLNWQKTEDFYINVTARQNLGAVLCGDSVGNIWIYDLDRYIEECPERIARDFSCVPYKVLEWPECNVTGSERQCEGLSTAASPELKSPVINTVDLSSDGLYIIAVTDNNLVCIWQLSKPNPK